MNKTEFFEILHKLNGFSVVDEEICGMLEHFQPGISDDALVVFAIYFSLVADGNVCMTLNPKKLDSKWANKWKGLIVAADLDEETAKEYGATGFAEIIENGINQIKSSELGLIVAREANENGKLFVIKEYEGDDWLFMTKYYHAVNCVGQKLGSLFQPKEVENLEDEKRQVIEYFERVSKANTGKAISLNNKQAEAIVRGQKENLVISGGPGYGKTTVVCYLLWKLLEENPDILNNYNIYLAAPSGKAQDRLKESINDELKKLGETNKDVSNKLTNAPSFTIHRLLSYNPQNNKFRYNKEQQFPEESIFVIDEASMIDICLFQNLLEAIPDGARLFILGDPFQLPSVQAGAVLGDILDPVNHIVRNIVELDQSNRFKADSVLGGLARKIKERETGDFGFSEWSVAEDDFSLTNEAENYPISYISLKQTDVRARKEQINDIASKWADRFCNYSAECNLSDTVEEPELESLWKKVNSARILCAERRGMVGIENLNKLVSEKVRNRQGGEYYRGMQLIITQNQKMFDLYNGDCGVVVSFTGSNIKYLMLEKPSFNSTRVVQNGDDIKRVGRYIFYPIHIIPKDSIEMAFAITIHKAQGSGYDNIMVFIPEKLEHPLLNNQIIYTAVTRSKGCTYVVGTNDSMNQAIKNKIERDTKICVPR